MNLEVNDKKYRCRLLDDDEDISCGTYLTRDREPATVTAYNSRKYYWPAQGYIQHSDGTTSKARWTCAGNSSRDDDEDYTWDLVFELKEI